MAEPETTPVSGTHVSLEALERLRRAATGFSLLPRQPSRSLLAGLRASRLRGRGLNFEEIRRYQPGDDVRTMDWRVTARTRKPHVRVYTEERDRPCLLLVDQRRCMFFGSRRTMKSVVAAEIAALIAWRVVAAGDRVGAVVFDDSGCVEIPPLRSRERVIEILSAVVAKNLDLGPGDTAPSNPAIFDEALARAKRLAPHDALVCLISDGFGLDPGSKFPAGGIAEHNDLIGFFVYDPLEAALPEAGRVVFGDGERRIEVDTGSASLREAYAGDYESRRKAFRRLGFERGTPLLEISTARPADLQVREQLGSVP